MTDTFEDAFNPHPLNNIQNDVVEEVHDEVQEDQTEEAVEELVEDNTEVAEQEDTKVEPTQSAADEHEEDEKTGRHVPLATFLDMRDKMKAHKEAEERFQRELEEYRKPKEEVKTYDPLTNPQEYAQHIRAEIEQAVFNERLVMSEQIALTKYSREDIAEATKWAQDVDSKDPRFGVVLRQQPNPVEWVVQQHKTQVEHELMLKDPKAFARSVAEKEGWIGNGGNTDVVAPQVTPAKKVLPRSLSNVKAGSNGVGRTREDVGVDFDAAFNPRKR